MEKVKKFCPRTGDGQTIPIKESIAVGNLPIRCGSTITTAVSTSTCTGLGWRDLIRIILLGVIVVIVIFIIFVILFIFLVLLVFFIVLFVVVKFTLLGRMFARFSTVDLRWMRLRLLCGRSRAARCTDEGSVLVDLDGTRKRTGTGWRGMGAARGNIALLDVRVLL